MLTSVTTLAGTAQKTNLPLPVLFHPLKHHLGYIRAFIQEHINAEGNSISTALQSIGKSQLDFYTGPMTPLQIAEEVILYLQKQNILQPQAYLHYLTETGSHYRTVTLSDNTDWVLRWGIVTNRYVHLHPARYAAHTIRVKATSLKTAIAATIASRQEHASLFDLQLVNIVRTEWLCLPPLTAIYQHEGAGELIALLNAA